MFLSEPEFGESAERLFEVDEEYMGWTMNATKLWAWQPESLESLFDLMGLVSPGLTMRQRGILVTACAATLGDSYCSLAWGGKLTNAADAETAAGVLIGTDEQLSEAERVLARWARSVTRDPNSTTQADVDELRVVGFSDPEIFAITAFVALRIAFSTVNDALGSQPDPELRGFSPPEVVGAVDFGRPIAD